MSTTQRLFSGMLGLTVAAVAAATTVGSSAGASVQQDVVVASVPSAKSPAVMDGRVLAIAKVGSSLVAVGPFTQVTSNGVIVPRSGVVAFAETTGTVSDAFDPQITGPVTTVAAGPTAGTVYVGGKITAVNGTAVNKLALLNLSDGSLVSTFKAPPISGSVEDLALVGGRLIVAGTFTTVGGKAHAGLASMTAGTGALDPFVNLQFSGHHNYNGTGAFSAVGVKKIDVTPGGTRLAAIGNFTDVSGSTRDQLALLDLSGGAAAVSDWYTSGYEDPCSPRSFDSYVRDVDFSPDGSYFVVVDTGGPHPGTLCDTAVRWETSASGLVSPTWVDETGGDTLFSVAVTGTAVYVGGHQRWLNNPLGTDSARAGAVPRPGLGALDPKSGVPLSWNPGRNPRGVGVFALLPTSYGLWVGSDTQYIGNFKYLRPRLAVFPLAGGSAVGPGRTLGLPGKVYLGGTGTGTAKGKQPPATTPLRYRQLSDTGSAGPEVAAPDGGIDWSTVRAATYVDGTLYYGRTNGMLYQRSFDGTTYGAEVAVDPYNDPLWSTLNTGSGQTYRGVQPSLYGQLASLRGMTVSNGRLYYTIEGQSGLYWRWFSPESGIVGERGVQSVGTSFANTEGLFVSGDDVYTVDRSSGDLQRTLWRGGAPTGGFIDVSGPSLGGIDWRANAVFVGP